MMDASRSGAFVPGCVGARAVALAAGTSAGTGWSGVALVAIAEIARRERDFRGDRRRR